MIHFNFSVPVANTGIVRILRMVWGVYYPLARMERNSPVVIIVQ
jgi:hypothetical protein